LIYDFPSRESVPLFSAGASIFILLPSAFVTLSSAAMEALTPASRLRIVAAGPFHNLVFWCVLVSAAKLGIGWAFWSMLYRDISSLGIVVIALNMGGFYFDQNIRQGLTFDTGFVPQ
jgi:S2P endopeptidase